MRLTIEWRRSSGAAGEEEYVRNVCDPPWADRDGSRSIRVEPATAWEPWGWLESDDDESLSVHRWVSERTFPDVASAREAFLALVGEAFIYEVGGAEAEERLVERWQRETGEAADGFIWRPLASELLRVQVRGARDVVLKIRAYPNDRLSLVLDDDIAFSDGDLRTQVPACLQVLVRRVAANVADAIGVERRMAEVRVTEHTALVLCWTGGRLGRVEETARFAARGSLAADETTVKLAQAVRAYLDLPGDSASTDDFIPIPHAIATFAVRAERLLSALDDQATILVGGRRSPLTERAEIERHLRAACRLAEPRPVPGTPEERTRSCVLTTA